MTELPALRESLRATANRRYGPRRHVRHVPAALVTATAAAAGVAIVLGRGAAPHELQAAGTPAPVATAAKKADPADASLQRLLSPGHMLVRAWTVADMKGHVLLSRKDGEWCLSAPDVGHGITCGSERRLERDGLKLRVGGGTVEVGRLGDVKIKRTAHDSAVVLHTKQDRHGPIVLGHRLPGAEYTIYQR
jgi:hypothetical protein